MRKRWSLIEKAPETAELTTVEFNCCQQDRLRLLKTRAIIYC